jgi:hypothetical protein
MKTNNNNNSSGSWQCFYLRIEDNNNNARVLKAGRSAALPNRFPGINGNI